jgi:hypothetical protein
MNYQELRRSLAIKLLSVRKISLTNLFPTPQAFEGTQGLRHAWGESKDESSEKNGPAPHQPFILKK